MKQQIGEFLATLRKANGYTQQEIADKLGISNKTLSNWECDKALPDLLLLPALAVLYGVTVDEILAGERKSREDKILTNKAEKSVLRSKLTRFSAHSWILIGIIILGLLFMLAGSLFGATTVVGIVMLSLSVVCLIVGLSVLFALWSGTDCGVDESTEIGRAYCIFRRRKLSECLCVVALCFFVLWLFFAEWMFVDVVIHSGYMTSIDYLGNVTGRYDMSKFYVEFNWTRIVLTLLAVSVPISFFLIGKNLHRKALLKWGDEDVRNKLLENRKFCVRVAKLGLIPFASAIVLTVISSLIGRFVLFDYEPIGILTGVLITGVDVIVCCALCVKKQYKCEHKF